MITAKMDKMDYRELALRFVLSEDPRLNVDVATASAKRLAQSPREIKDWILSVSRWLSPKNPIGEDEVDMITYSKAVDYLSSTLDKLDKTSPTFNAAQIELLSTFFLNIVQNQHGGILASYRALINLAEMPRFKNCACKPKILAGIEDMGDYFRQQPSTTRLVIYRLLQALIASLQDDDLDLKAGPKGSFMKGIFEVCKNERDPDCLLVWFGVMRDFLRKYNESSSLTESTFTLFSTYFPITIRATQTPAGVTGDDLKRVLRECFAADDSIASLAVPFLTEKLERGDGMTLSARTDTLQTLEACLTQYTDVSKTIAPYASKIWLTLKHEVRSGDEPDAIKLALQAIRKLIGRLDGDDLASLLSTIATDCHEDLTSPSGTDAAGKLLVVVMSAKPSAFGQLATQTISFLQRQLAGSSNAQHLRDLVVALNSILELRPNIMGLSPSEDVQPDILAGLFGRTYKPLTQHHLKEGADQDDFSVACKALRGLGLLATQPIGGDGEYKRLLDDAACQEICTQLATTITGTPDVSRFDEVVQEAAASLAHISPAYQDAIQVFASLTFNQETRTISPATVRQFAPVLVHIGTQELPAGREQLSNFVFVVATLAGMLQPLNDSSWDSQEASADLAVGILNAMMQFKTRFLSSATQVVLKDSPFAYAARAFTELAKLDGTQAVETSDPIPELSLEEAFFSVCLFLTRYLILQTTTVVKDEGTGRLQLSLAGTPGTSQHERLRLVTIGRIATFSLRHIEPACQIHLNLPSQILCLFHLINIEGVDNTPAEEQLSLWSAWELLAPTSGAVSEGIIQISLGIAQGISASGVQTLKDTIPLHVIFLQGLLDKPDSPSLYSPSLKALIAIIANKFPAENDSNIVGILTLLIDRAIVEGDLTEKARLALLEMVTIATGAIMRRAKGGRMTPVLEKLALAPTTPKIGQHIARKLEQITAPILDNESGTYLTIPTWKSKIYHQLVLPMLSKAMPRPDIASDELLVCSNYRIAVLGLLRWIGYSVYENDVEAVLRAAVCLAQDLPNRREAASALMAIRVILSENESVVKGHLETVVRLCQQSLEQSEHQRPAWMPADYTEQEASPRATYNCQVLVLSILMIMAQKFSKNDSQVQAAATTVNRVLTQASGLSVRSLREKVRVARNAWRAIKG